MVLLKLQFLEPCEYMRTTLFNFLKKSQFVALIVAEKKFENMTLMHNTGSKQKEQYILKTPQMHF